MLSYVKYQVNSETSIQILKINQVSSYKHQNLNLKKVLWKMKIMVLKKSEISDHEYLSDFTKLQTYKYEHFFTCFKSVRKKKCSGKELSVSEEDTSKI